MRVIFRGEGLPTDTLPQEIPMDLLYVPNVGDYVSFGDSIQRHVSEVIRDVIPHDPKLEFDPSRLAYYAPHGSEIHVVLRMGRPGQ